VARPGRGAKQDYEYVRRGTRNLFVAVEPQGGHREVTVTARRTKVDFVEFVGSLLQTVYGGVRKLHLVLDNLNTHFRASFEEVLGPAAAAVMLQRCLACGQSFEVSPLLPRPTSGTRTGSKPLSRACGG